jgi:hypothetical protein
MKKIFPYLAAAAIFAGCATPKELLVEVTTLGEEPAKLQEQYIYALPQTVLKLEFECEEVSSFPGPYRDYAEKYLGITEVIKQKSSLWQIRHLKVTAHSELDPQHFYSLNVLEGALNEGYLDRFIQKGILMDGSQKVHETLNGPELQATGSPETISYVDLGVYPNYEERSETMYKTLVTDTSFVRVPVQRTVVEQKSFAMKAEEAADFLLELRARRFEMLTGEYEVYPDGVAMAAAINKLDQLEESYLTLFIGRTVSRMVKRSYFIVPQSGSTPSQYHLDMFSSQLGFVPSELMEGIPLEVQIEPLGKTNRPGTYFSRSSTGKSYNGLLYRMPDIVELKVNLGSELLSQQRISIFQAGAVVTTPVK